METKDIIHDACMFVRISVFSFIVDICTYYILDTFWLKISFLLFSFGKCRNLYPIKSKHNIFSSFYIQRIVTYFVSQKENINYKNYNKGLYIVCIYEKNTWYIFTHVCMCILKNFLYLEIDYAKINNKKINKWKRKHVTQCIVFVYAYYISF